MKFRGGDNARVGATNRNDGNAGGDLVYENRDVEFAAFDSLPRECRNLLNYTSNKFIAAQFTDLIKRRGLAWVLGKIASIETDTLGPTADIRTIMRGEDGFDRQGRDRRRRTRIQNRSVGGVDR